MKEKIKLLTLCGCSRMVEIEPNAQKYICAIQYPDQKVFLFDKKEPFPEIQVTNSQRVFRYNGKKTKDTLIRIFQEANDG